MSSSQEIEQQLGGLLGVPPLSGPPPVKPFKSDKKANRRGGKMIKSEMDQLQLKEALEKEVVKEERGGKSYHPPQFVLKYLERKDLRPLKQRSKKFPKANYYCRLCDYHCDTLGISLRHISDTRHSRLTRMAEMETTLYHLPAPSRDHLAVLEQLLNKTKEEEGLTTGDMVERNVAVETIDQLVQKEVPGCRVRLYGSSLTGFGLKDADINMDLHITDEQLQPHKVLLKAFEVLSSCKELSEVTRDFDAKNPLMLFQVTLPTTGQRVSCRLSLANNMPFFTSHLLRDYYQLDPRVASLGVCLRHWARICQLDRQAEGTLPPHTFALMLIHFLQRLKKPVLPCLHDFQKSKDTDTYESPTEAMSSWSTRNTLSVAELWIEFFEYYALDYRNNDFVVSVRDVKGLSFGDKQWTKKKLAVEDPFSTKRNLCRSVNNSSIHDYIMDCIKTAHLYFGSIQTTGGAVITKISLPNEPIVPKQDDDDVLTLTEVENVEVDECATLEDFQLQFGTDLTPKLSKKVSSLVPRNMIVFRFDKHTLTCGSSPTVLCTVCGNEGHVHSNCPDEELPEMRPMPPLPEPYKQLLDQVFVSVMKGWEPPREEISAREYIIHDLARFISKTYPTAVLTVFGSSKNGFAFSRSDLDISLTFSDHETDETVNTIEVIEKLADKMKRMPGIRNILAITSAKVPIIKFSHLTQRHQVEGDISLYNILAQENTEMLKCYSVIDPRVRILGYNAKLFAKFCEIGDASRGSLSSYAYVLMLIHYLQQCSPPVIPVLQELHDGDEKPVKMVDGWNAWFFKDLSRLPQVWPDFGKNKQSVTDLWLGFLRYYATEFDDKSNVVCIRQKAMLTKFEKLWNSPAIAIEDPFDLNHNLGAGISRKMHLFIKKTFMISCMHFGRLPRNPMNFVELKHFLFDPGFMTDGSPPNDRGCRACGKIGHLVRDCPRRRYADERKAKRVSERGDANNSKDASPSPPEQAINPQPANPDPVNPLLSLLLSSTAPLPPAPKSAINAEDLERDLTKPAPPPGFAVRPPPFDLNRLFAGQPPVNIATRDPRMAGPFGNPFGLNALGQNPLGPNTPGQNPFGQNPLGANPLGPNLFGVNPILRPNQMGQNSFGANPLAQPLGQNPTGLGIGPLGALPQRPPATLPGFAHLGPPFAPPPTSFAPPPTEPLTYALQMLAMNSAPSPVPPAPPAPSGAPPTKEEGDLMNLHWKP